MCWCAAILTPGLSARRLYLTGGGLTVREEIPAAFLPPMTVYAHNDSDTLRHKDINKYYIQHGLVYKFLIGRNG